MPTPARAPRVASDTTAEASDFNRLATSVDAGHGYNGPVDPPAPINAPRMTTAQRDALSGVNDGAEIYNTTTSQLETYRNSAWEASGSGGGGGQPSGDGVAFTAAEKAKLAGIEARADVTDTTNVSGAFPLMQAAQKTQVEDALNFWSPQEVRTAIIAVLQRFDGIIAFGSPVFDANMEKLTSSFDRDSAYAALKPFFTGTGVRPDDTNKRFTISGGSGGGGATTFLALTDTPDDFTGEAGKILEVNSAGTALVLVDKPSGGTGTSRVQDLTDIGAFKAGGYLKRGATNAAASEQVLPIPPVDIGITTGLTGNLRNATNLSDAYTAMDNFEIPLSPSALARGTKGRELAKFTLPTTNPSSTAGTALTGSWTAGAAIPAWATVSGNNFRVNLGTVPDSVSGLWLEIYVSDAFRLASAADAYIDTRRRGRGGGQHCTGRDATRSEWHEHDVVLPRFQRVDDSGGFEYGDQALRVPRR